MDLSKLGNEALSAAMRGGTDNWGRIGSASENIRYKEKTKKYARRTCRCGCQKKITHLGMANGVCLMSGCELSVARWVKTGWVKTWVKTGK